MTPGDRIKILRASYLGLTLEQFGDTIGLKKSAVSKLENNINGLTKVAAKAICREYNVNYDWLIYGEGDMFNDASLIERLETFLANDSDGSFTALFDAILSLSSSECQALSVLIQKIRKD